MSEQDAIERAREDAREGKSASTQAGEFVREVIERVREGKEEGVKSAKQAIAIGLSKARRAGVKLLPRKGSSAKTKKKAKQDLAKGQKRARGASKRSGSAKKAGRTRKAGGGSAARKSTRTRARRKS
ncbi:MAG TPA: DUF6496 domain-containing protein [Gemmatimonadaceae bacterium]|nr:DUF6496 domain-containing protein [Gemmatimonadaceae bacterium]